MRRILLSLAAASAIVSAASLVPVSANAMTAGTASGVRAAIDETSVLDEVRYVCVHRGYSARRCWWRPGGYYYRPYYRRYYRRW